MKLLHRIEAVRALDLPDPQKHLLVWLAFHAGASWPRCWPSRETLARDCGCSVRSIERRTAALASRGLIDVHRQRRRSNVYVLRLPPRPDNVTGQGASDCRVKGRQIVALTRNREPRTADRGLEGRDWLGVSWN